MIIDISKFEELTRFNPKLLSDYNLVSFNTLSKDLEPKKAEPGKLYVIYSSYLSIIDNVSDAAGYICINDNETALCDHKFHFPVVLLNTKAKPRDVFEKIKTSIFSKSIFDDERDLLLDALVSDKGIHNILNIAGKIYRNPLYFIDGNYRMIAWSNNIKVDEPVWNQAVADGFVSSQMIEAMRKIRVPEFGQVSEKPKLVPIPKTDKHSIDSSIFIKGRFVGCVGMCNHSSPFRDGDIEAVELVGKIISIQLQKSDFYRSLTGDPYESFFFDLLKSPLSSEMIERRARILNLKFEEKYLVLVVNPDKTEINKNLSSKMIQTELKEIIRTARSIIFHENIVMIIAVKNDNMLDTKIMSKIEDYLKIRGSIAGLSNTSSDYSLLRIFYEQACIALMYGSKNHCDRVMHFYSDHIFDYMLQLSLEKDTQINFIHPAIDILKEHDEKWGTDHLGTLIVFINSLGNMSKAAQILNIHYNTMKYRIKTIQNLAAIDLKNQDTYINISISIRQLTEDKKCN